MWPIHRYTIVVTFSWKRVCVSMYLPLRAEIHPMRTLLLISCFIPIEWPTYSFVYATVFITLSLYLPFRYSHFTFTQTVVSTVDWRLIQFRWEQIVWFEFTVNRFIHGIIMCKFELFTAEPIHIESKFLRELFGFFPIPLIISCISPFQGSFYCHNNCWFEQQQNMKTI